MGAASGHELHWYGLNIESPLAWKPSDAEAADPTRATDLRMIRDRHVLLPPAALQQMVLRVAVAGRSRPRYLAQRQAGRHYAELHQGGVLKPHCLAHGASPNGRCGMSAGVPAATSREAAAAAAEAAGVVSGVPTAASQPAAGQLAAVALESSLGSSLETALPQLGPQAADLAGQQAGGQPASTPANAGLVAGTPWHSLSLRRADPVLATLGALAFLLSAAAIRCSASRRARRRQPPRIISIAGAGAWKGPQNA